MTRNGEMYLAGETKTKGDFEQKKHKLDMDKRNLMNHTWYLCNTDKRRKLTLMPKHKCEMEAKLKTQRI